MELFAITFKESGEILNGKTLDAFRKLHPAKRRSYWRPSKKIYFTRGMAESGFSYLPEDLKPHLAITVFLKAYDLEGGEALVAKQAEKKVQRAKKRENDIAKWRLESAQRELQQAQQKLASLENS